MKLRSKNKRYTCARCGGHEVYIITDESRKTPMVRCKSCATAKKKIYHKKNLPRFAKNHRVYKSNHQIETLVRDFSNVLERKGVLGIPGSCLLCGSRENLEKHHLNPINPFSVIRLCRKCHRGLHSHFSPYFITRKGVMEYELSGLQYRYVVRWDQTLQTNHLQNLLL